MQTLDTYNYLHFSFALEEPELARWLQAGPRPGDAAPDFELEDLQGQPLRLSSLQGHPVVLEFGSYTCPIFSDRVPDMELLAREHPESEFLVVAVREAHPGEVTGPHLSQAHKRQAARRLVVEEGLRRRVLVDGLQGTVHCSYGGAWNPVYVIDAEGWIAFRRMWNHPGEVAQALDALAGGGSVQPGESIAMPALPGRSAVGLRLLERGGRQALLDFYRSAPAPVRQRLQESQSEAVRGALKKE